MLFVPKASTHVECWNVRLLGNLTKQNGRLHDVLRTLKEKAIEILALSEVRSPGHGVSRMEEAVIVYSGIAASERQCHSCRVAMMFSE